MERFINIGFGNVINVSKVAAIVKPEAAPVKRMVQSAKDENRCIDATCGRKCKSVMVTDEGYVVLSALLPDTVAGRANEK